MKIFKQITIIILCVSMSISSFADFEDIGAGGRTVGLGNAYTALADDAFSIYYNPAGLGFIKQGQVGADYGKLWMGLDDGSDLSNSFVSVLVPYFRPGTTGTRIVKKKTKRVRIKKKKPKKQKKKKPKKKKDKKKGKASILEHYKSALDTSTATATAQAEPPKEQEQPKEEDSKKEKKEEVKSEKGEGKPESVPVNARAEAKKGKKFLKHWSTFAVGWKKFSLFGHYRESAYYLSFGRVPKEKFAYGASLKILSEKYTIDDYLRKSPVFSYGSKDSVTNYSIDLGCIYNLLPRLFVGAAINDLNQPNLGLKNEDRLPATLRLGLAWRQRTIRWATDIIYRSNKWYGSTGLEKWYKNIIALRGGINFGGENYANSGLGFSMNFVTAQIDYAYQLPLAGIKEIGGSHRMTLTYRFGRTPKEELKAGSLELYYSKLKEEYETLKIDLSEVKAEKKQLEEVLVEEATMRIRERIKAAKAAARGRSKKTKKKQKDIRHIVRAGETLKSIAVKYYKAEKYWDKIYQANKADIGRGGVLRTNQVLIIPGLTSSAPSSTSSRKVKSSKKSGKGVQMIEVTPASTAPRGRTTPVKVKAKPKPKPRLRKKASGPRKHVVKPGENLRSIAKKYYNNSSLWKKIYKANKNKVIGGQVSPGQEIVIP